MQKHPSRLLFAFPLIPLPLDFPLSPGVEQMKSEGIEFRKGITDFGFWKYIMVPAPDDILIELFQVDKSSVPAELVEYFEFE